MWIIVSRQFKVMTMNETLDDGILGITAGEIPMSRWGVVLGSWHAIYEMHASDGLLLLRRQQSERASNGKSIEPASTSCPSERSCSVAIDS